MTSLDDLGEIAPLVRGIGSRTIDPAGSLTIDDRNQTLLNQSIESIRHVALAVTRTLEGRIELTRQNLGSETLRTRLDETIDGKLATLLDTIVNDEPTMLTAELGIMRVERGILTETHFSLGTLC